MNDERPCPACGAIDWEPRWSDFIVCRHCGLMTVSRNYTAAELTAHYQESYFSQGEYANYAGDKSVQQKLLGKNLERMRRFVPSGASILEIGCAFGFFLELIRDEFPGSVGVDVTGPGIAHARTLGLDARLGDFLEMPFEKKFQGVCLWDTIEHLRQPGEFLKKASELLLPGGMIFLTTGDFGALLPRMQGRGWRQIHPPTHLFYFTRKALAEMGARAGLQAVSFQSVPIYRRLGSSLQVMDRFYGRRIPGRAARALQRLLPKPVLRLDFPLNLGDTVFAAFRK